MDRRKFLKASASALALSAAPQLLLVTQAHAIAWGDVLAAGAAVTSYIASQNNPASNLFSASIKQIEAVRILTEGISQQMDSVITDLDEIKRQLVQTSADTVEIELYARLFGRINDVASLMFEVQERKGTAFPLEGETLLSRMEPIIDNFREDRSNLLAFSKAYSFRGIIYLCAATVTELDLVSNAAKLSVLGSGIPKYTDATVRAIAREYRGIFDDSLNSVIQDSCVSIHEAANELLSRTHKKLVEESAYEERFLTPGAYPYGCLLTRDETECTPLGDTPERGGEIRPGSGMFTMPPTCLWNFERSVLTVKTATELIEEVTQNSVVLDYATAERSSVLIRVGDTSYKSAPKCLGNTYHRQRAPIDAKFTSLSVSLDAYNKARLLEASTNNTLIAVRTAVESLNCRLAALRSDDAKCES